MDIHDLEYEEIEPVEGLGQQKVVDLLSNSRRPVILRGLNEDFEFLENWTLEFFGSLDTEVPVQKPESDGVNYFFRYFPISFSDFVSRIKKGENLYIGAREFLTKNGEASNQDGLAGLASSFRMPPWVDPARIWSANLWIGAGNNRTLLHYDPWNSIQILREGKKTFYILPETASPQMHQYHPLNFKALYLGKVLHSKVKPIGIQPQYAKELQGLKGFKAEIGPGDVIMIPAGFWHYVESEGRNIGINFFVHAADKSIHRKEPLRTYWIKDNITLWPIRLFMKTKYHAMRTIRQFLPKKAA